MKGKLYRIIMKISHRYNWHYAPPCYPDGDTQLWCKWCGMRYTIRRRFCPVLDLEAIETREKRATPERILDGK